MPIKDVVVTINVAYPAARIGLGRPAIFATTTGDANYKEYSSIEALEKDFARDTAVYKKASYVFMQANRPDKVAVATYSGDIGAALEEFYDRSWHFALIADDNATAQEVATDFIETKDYKFVAVQVKDASQRLAMVGKERTIVFDHDKDGEHLDAAAIGHLASLPVGSITWKFHELKGITPRELTELEMSEIDEDFAIAYVKKSGQGQLSEGTLANGEYIDVLHGKDWIKTDMENEISYALSQAAKFNTKLPFDNRGIGAIRAAATTSLERGFNNGIIAETEDGLKDYNINTLNRDEVDPVDRANRLYNGLTFDFALAGAIHEARVKGAIRI